MLVISIILGLFLSSVGNQVGDCNDFLLRKLLEGPPRSRNEYHNQYENLSYEYGVVIPKGLIGYDGRDETNHQGFGLALGKPLESFIFVRGEPNSFEYNRPQDAATKSVEYLRQDAKKIESETISKSRLGTLNAVRLEVIYTCPGSADRHVLSSITALSADKRFLYKLELYSLANRYKSDQIKLNQLIKSWKKLPNAKRQKR